MTLIACMPHVQSAQASQNQCYNTANKHGMEDPATCHAPAGHLLWNAAAQRSVTASDIQPTAKARIKR